MAINRKIIVLILTIVISYLYLFSYSNSSRQRVIKIGILHSRTGPLAFSETPVIDTTLFAINEINTNGGVLKKLIEPILADGKSDPDTFAKEAEKLITENKVEALFGCWTSASRKAVKPIIEKYNKLLFYPVQYEGLEESKNIIYLDLTPNQQILPAIAWLINNVGKKIFLVGSDYIYPRAANEIIKEIAPKIGATIVGDEYLNLKDENFTKIIQKISITKPDIIINTINGSGNIPFFKELNKIQTKDYPINIVSFSLSENDFNLLDTSNIKGIYLCWSYTEHITSKENIEFLKKFKSKFGKHREVNDAMQTAYMGVYSWENAVRLADTTETSQVIKKLTTFVFDSPQGIVKIEQDGNTWNPVYIIQIHNNKKSEIIWQSGVPVEPIAFPNNFFISKFIKNKKNQIEWTQFLDNLYKKWGGQWEAN